MSEHSPAPWSIRQSATHVTVVTASGDAIFHDDKRLPGVMEDARLIAAAPELLEALQAMVEETCVNTVGGIHWQAKAVIAKATGGDARSLPATSARRMR